MNIWHVIWLAQHLNPLYGGIPQVLGFENARYWLCRGFLQLGWDKCSSSQMYLTVGLRGYEEFPGASGGGRWTEFLGQLRCGSVSATVHHRCIIRWNLMLCNFVSDTYSDLCWSWIWDIIIFYLRSSKPGLTVFLEILWISNKCLTFLRLWKLAIFCSCY